MHPGGMKMYHDLHRQYYWSRMKRPTGQGCAPEASRATPAIGDSGVQVGAHHDGLCDSLSMDIAEA